MIKLDPVPGRLVVRGVNWLGDAVMSTPALMRLRQAFPAAYIAMVTQEKLAGMWVEHPAVDGLITLSRLDTPWTVAKRLRSEKFDLGIAFPNSPRSALELFMAQIPIRVGFESEWRRWLLTHPVAPRADHVKMRKYKPGEVKDLVASKKRLPPREPLPPGAHHIYNYLHLTAQIGASPTPLAPVVRVLPEELEVAAKRFGLLSSSGRKRMWLAINPGAEYGAAKRWPRERFSAAAIQLSRKLSCGWMILGGASDTKLAAAIEGDILAGLGRSGARGLDPMVINLAGKTELRDLCALLKHCTVLVSNDTGPMHLAAALKTPVVAVFGSTSPELTCPGLPGANECRVLRGKAVCSPCYLRDCPIDFRCMTSITVQDVVKVVLELAL